MIFGTLWNLLYFLRPFLFLALSIFPHFNFGYYVSYVTSDFNFPPILLPGGLHECTLGQNTAPR